MLKGCPTLFIFPRVPVHAPTTGPCPSSARPQAKGIPLAVTPHATPHNPLSDPRAQLLKPPSPPGRISCNSPSPVTHPLQTAFPATAHAAVTPDSGARMPRVEARRAGPRPYRPNRGKPRPVSPTSGAQATPPLSDAGCGLVPLLTNPRRTAPLLTYAGQGHAPSLPKRRHPVLSERAQRSWALAVTTTPPVLRC